MEEQKEKKIYAYCRVSKNDGSMNLDNQIHAIQEYAKKHDIKIDEYYQDECKGDTPPAKRSQLPVMLEHLKEGYTVIVAECSRLHRSCAGLEALYREIIENKKCEFITLEEKEQVLCTNGTSDDLIQISMKKIVLTILGTVAEMEKNNIKARTKRALEERKARGKILGRPKIEPPQNFKELYKKAENKEITHVQAMKALGLKKTSYYKLAKTLNEGK